MGNVLIAGDLHGNATFAQALLQVAKRKDCARVFVVGDFGAWEHMHSGRRYFDVVNRAAKRAGVTVYFLDGNHDKSSLLHELYDDHPDDEGFLICRTHLRYAPRGHRWNWEGTSFAAFGGAASTDKAWRLAKEARKAAKAETRRRYGSSKRPQTAGTLWFPEEEMTDEELDALLEADSSPVDILLTHDKPRAAEPPWNRKDKPECYPNQDRIQRVVHTLRPAVLFHGHLHVRYTDTIASGDGQWTRVEGLACDPEAAQYLEYSTEHSWYVLELPYAEQRLESTGGTESHSLPA
ncbi:metallophosphoesterase family protein [Nocardia sp. CDC160]|uniref:metallophosphoesterase family protein n=1 Tax=Nocardia sp. CDC160 TaxID=3112166 RepID=UPI002DBBE9A1|nr:metallophosphoesterase [Nocardia sp. CDC160]MEC3913659.1 metallophosphoesterase [Nocardia sp. CDC160]